MQKSAMSPVDVPPTPLEDVVADYRNVEAPRATIIAGSITKSDVSAAELQTGRNMISPSSRTSLRRIANGTEKQNSAEESEKEIPASIESRTVRQSTRSRTPRQTYQDEFFAESEQVSLQYD